MYLLWCEIGLLFHPVIFCKNTHNVNNYSVFCKNPHNVNNYRVWAVTQRSQYLRRRVLTLVSSFCWSLVRELSRFSLGSVLVCLRTVSKNMQNANIYSGFDQQTYCVESNSANIFITVAKTFIIAFETSFLFFNSFKGTLGNATPVRVQ